MRLIPIIVLLTWGCAASGTTYYVSSSGGNDANGGTSTSTPWQTVGHVNGQTFLAGDSILFLRGDVWNESLIPLSSGSSGNPITFDAYGTGAAPNLTGYYAVPSSAWVLVTGNAWKAAVPATFSTINFCLFGSIWGQKVAAATSNLTAQRNFYLANGFVYVYSVGNPAMYYNQPIVPMALSNVPVINVSGQSWLTFQHFRLNWFDQYGVYVQGNSDHLVFANMEADSMIPQGTQPLGFYVNESAPGPGDIKIYNTEAHMNYDGFRFDGTALGIALVNDKAYGNRDGGLVDNTSAATYSHCHFYGSSLAVAGSTDVEWTSGTGPIAGAGNIAPDTAPAVQVWQRYPAEVTLTVDDAGMTPGTDTYYASTVLPIADAASVPVGAAVTVGYPLAQTLISEFQGWVNAGRDVTSHSMSHTYYTNTDALEIQYIGSGTAATLSISGKVLTIAVTGAGDSVSYNLAQGQPQATIKGLRLALAATGKFTATEIQTCQGPYGTGCSAFTEAALLAQDLADVSGQDVKPAVYHMQLDVTRLTTDEITLSRQWMTTNLTGLPTTPVYVYPGGYETTTMQGITAGVPYSGARGALKEDLGVKDTYANGFNVQNVTSFGVNPSWQGLPAATLNQKIQAMVWKQRVWGVPWGIFWHLNELSVAEITNLIQDLKTSGATIQSNTGLVNWLLGGTQEAGTDGNSYNVLPATNTTLDFRPSKNSPVVDAGQNLGTAYALDINGVNQNSYGTGWEIGAHVFQGYAVYGEAGGAGTTRIGGLPTGCGGVLYFCANQTSAVIQTPVPPAFTQASVNTYGSDNSIYPGMPYLMATDYNSDPSHFPIQSTSAGSDSESEWNCKGRSDWSTACGNAPVYYYQGTVEGTALLFEFDPTQPSSSRVVNPVPSPSMFIGTGGSSGWSHKDPQTYYARSGGSTDLTIYKYVFNSTLSSYVKTAYVNLGQCPGISNSAYQTQPPTWVNSGILGIADGTDDITVGQGTTNWIVHWKAATNSCASLNTATGQFWGYCSLAGDCSSVAPSGAEPYLVNIHQYSARTDSTAQPYPGTIPCPSAAGCSGGGALLGAGYCFVPGDFNTTYCRVTDANTPTTSSSKSFITNCGGSAETNIMDSTDAIFYLCDLGNVIRIWNFNSTTLSFSLRHSGYTVPGCGSGATNNLFFSFTQPLVAYGSCFNAAGNPVIAQFDFTSSTTGPTVANGGITILVDLSTCAAALTGVGNTVYLDDVNASADDQTFAVAASTTAGQGSAGVVYAATWNRSTGCRVWNTNTNLVSGSGTTGSVTFTGNGVTSPATLPFTIHNVRLGKGGTYVRLTPSGIGFPAIYYWNLATLNVYEQFNDSTLGCGHAAAGYNLAVNQCASSGNHFQNFWSRPMNNTGVFTQVPATLPPPTVAPWDSHESWNNDDSSDTAPVFETSHLAGFTPNFAWDNEIMADAMDGSGTVWRFGHHYSTNISQFFAPSEEIGNVSADGKFYIWTTDWDGMLGKTDGVTAACVIGSTCRADVFLAALPIIPPATVPITVAASPNGAVAFISWNPPCPGTCSATGNILWSWDNPTLFAGSQSYNCLGSLGCNGHEAALNNSLIMNNDPNPKITTWANPGVFSGLGSLRVHAVGATGQLHFSNTSVDALDTNPVLVSTASPPQIGGWTTPYQDELFMVRYQGSGTYGIGTTARCCHTFSYASPLENFEAEDAIWTISPDGLYAIGNSSMMCTLGQTSEVVNTSTVNTTTGVGGTGVVTITGGKSIDTTGCALGFTVTINSNAFTIQSITDSTHFVTSTSPGTLTGVTATLNNAWSALFIVGPLTGN